MVVATFDKPMALFNVDGQSPPSMQSARIAPDRWPTAGWTTYRRLSVAWLAL
jgi:hypothetical protein